MNRFSPFAELDDVGTDGREMRSSRGGDGDEQLVGVAADCGEARSSGAGNLEASVRMVSFLQGCK